MTTSCGLAGGGGGGSDGCGGAGSSSGPCGACKYLRRKCVKGCIFAPYFDTEQGAAHFAAVHRVFGASNASKLLLRIPPQRRFDAVVTLCYEALSRVRDPVYGCVSHIFSLQQQVVNLQAELAYIQARLSTLQRLPHPPPPPSEPHSPPPPPHHDDGLQHPPAGISSMSCTSTTTALPLPFDPALQHALTDMTADQLAAGVGLSPLLDEDGCCDIQALSREFVYKYFSGVKFSPTD